MSTAVFAPGHVVAGRYRIQELLGQGGMGSVYRALQLSVGRPVALKLLSDEHVGSADLLERFQREAVALARLAHPNTVRLFDFGMSEGGSPFLVMEFLRGTDLAGELERQGPLRYDQALRVARQILCSLSEAHDAGIVHRDVKPANVFLCAGSSWPLVKVLDFGIVGDIAVDPVASRLTRTGTVIGSVAYMAPEQAQGLAVGPAADLYAVGVVLFEMLTGRTLFDARACTAQLIAKVMEPAPRLRDVEPALGVPAELEALVADLVERDAGRRPPSARVVIEHIDGLLERVDLPPLARSIASLRERHPSPVDTPEGALAGDGRSIPPTEPMLVPHSAREISATLPLGTRPLDTVAPLPPVSRRRAGSLAAAFMFVGVGAGVVGALLGPLRSTPAGQTLAAAATPLTRWLSAGEAPPEPALPEPAALAVPAEVIEPPSATPDSTADAASAGLPAAPASAAPLPVAQVVALEPLLPAPPTPEVTPPSPARVATSAPSAKPALPTPRRQAPPSRKPAPQAASPELEASLPSPKPAAAAATPGPAAPAPEPVITSPTPLPSVPPEPTPVAATPERVRKPPLSTWPVPARPDTLILPETAGSASSATPSASPAAPAREPAAPSDVERPPAPPITLDPSLEPAPREPAHERVRRERRASGRTPSPSSIAAVEAAYQAGQLSLQERDELMAVLRQMQAEAHARAERAYREGRIGRRELWLRHHEIDREFEGEAYRERPRARIRLRW